MIEHVERSSDPPDAGARPLVWVCVYEHRDGIDVWACETEDIAYRELADVCREFWDEAHEVEDSLVERTTGEAPLPAEPPSEDRAAVERFFAVMNSAHPPEIFFIAAHEIVGAPKAGRG
jgi:hypothetical protein